MTPHCILVCFERNRGDGEDLASFIVRFRRELHGAVAEPFKIVRVTNSDGDVIFEVQPD